MSDKKDSRLAKLYSLLENGEWLSKFTGIITISSDESQDVHTINILDPSNTDVSLHTIRINKAVDYEKSSDCLIQWKENEDDEFALSFLTEMHRDTIMNQINKICQTKETIDTVSQMAVDSDMSNPSCLPNVSMSTFTEICSQFVEMSIVSSQLLINKLMENDNEYLRKLFECADDFIGFDDLVPVHDLACGLCNLSNYLFTLGRIEFINLIFSDEFYLSLFNVSDYHTPLYKEKHNNLRETFETRVHYHKVLDFEDTSITELIHITFRMQFYRDSICLNILYTPFGDTLQNIINQNIIEITELICHHQEYAQLLMKMLNPEEDLTEPITLIYHLFPSQMTLMNRLSIGALFQVFCGTDIMNDGMSEEYSEMENEQKICDNQELNLLDCLEKLLAAKKQANSTIQKLVLLIEKICKLGNTYCCSYFFNKKNESGIHLFHMLIDLLLYCTDYGVQMSACGIIEELIGHDPIMSMDDLIFLRVFYSEFTHPLFDSFLEDTPSICTDSQLLLLNLLSIFISSHGSYIRGFLADGKLLLCLAKKLQTSSAVIKCAILQVFSTGVALTDSWFGSLLVDNYILDEILEITKSEVLQKNTLLSSKLLSFYNTALVKEQFFVLTRVAQSIPSLGISDVTPFSSILEWVHKKELEEDQTNCSSHEQSTRDKELKERMAEEAYFDTVDDDEDDNMNVVEDIHKEEEKEVEKKEEPAEKEETADSVDDFFGSRKPIKTNTPIKMSIKLNLSIPVDESDSKRLKIQQQDCFVCSKKHNHH